MSEHATTLAWQWFMLWVAIIGMALWLGCAAHSWKNGQRWEFLVDIAVFAIMFCCFLANLMRIWRAA